MYIVTKKRKVETYRNGLNSLNNSLSLLDDLNNVKPLLDPNGYYEFYAKVIKEREMQKIKLEQACADYITEMLSKL